jgi:hypothetical protein
LFWRERPKALPLLYADRYSTDWKVSEANSFTPSKIRTPKTLIQTFTSLDRKETVSVTINDYRNRSDEAEFPIEYGNTPGIPKRADATAFTVRD